jgi:hypothetical protein
MEGILAGLVNPGLGGLMAAALVWFLHQLAARTLPDMLRAFPENLPATTSTGKIRWRSPFHPAPCEGCPMTLSASEVVMVLGLLALAA